MFHSDDHYRRLQIGGIGFAGVILLVGLAGILGDRDGKLTTATVAQQDATGAAKDAPSSEPLSELGVQPAPPSEGKAVAPRIVPTLPQATTSNGNANALPPAVRPGERVQDLPPSTATARPQQ